MVETCHCPCHCVFCVLINRNFKLLVCYFRSALQRVPQSRVCVRDASGGFIMNPLSSCGAFLWGMLSLFNYLEIDHVRRVQSSFGTQIEEVSALPWFLTILSAWFKTHKLPSPAAPHPCCRPVCRTPPTPRPSLPGTHESLPSPQLDLTLTQPS